MNNCAGSVSRVNSRLPPRALPATALVIAVALLLSVLWLWHAGARGAYHHADGRTLVVYILSVEDPAFLDSFELFLQQAVFVDTTPTTYHILVAATDAAALQNYTLPMLPAHAQYVIHSRSCHGVSLLRWHLADGMGHVALQHAEHVVLLSSAVRGPFVPPGLRGHVNWHAALGLPLHSRTALVGSVVSCAQPIEAAGDAPRAPPFLELTVVAATRAGVELLLRLTDSDVPPCPPAVAPVGTDAAANQAGASGSAPAVQRTGSVGVLANDGLTASEQAAMRGMRAWCGATLRAGLRLASLAVRQRGVDWADPRTWDCNGGIAPFVEHANDGLSLGAHEALFVPVTSYDNDLPAASAADHARAYTEWMQAEGRTAGSVHGSASIAAAQPLAVRDARAPAPERRLELVLRNRYFGLGAVYKLPAVLFAVALGEGCFDVDFFRENNPDVAMLPARDAWKFYVFAGQFQPRPFRLKCGIDWSKFGLRSAGGQRSGQPRAATTSKGTNERP